MVTMFPDCENRRSHGTVVAGDPRYFIARLAMTGCAPAWDLHHSSGQESMSVWGSALKRRRAVDEMDLWARGSSSESSEEYSNIRRLFIGGADGRDSECKAIVVKLQIENFIVLFCYCFKLVMRKNKY